MSLVNMTIDTFRDLYTEKIHTHALRQPRRSVAERASSPQLCNKLQCARTGQRCAHIRPASCALFAHVLRFPITGIMIVVCTIMPILPPEQIALIVSMEFLVMTCT